MSISNWSEGKAISVIVPTYGERDNIKPLVERIAQALSGREYEVIVVDDSSPDGTAEAARGLGEAYPVEVIVRTGKRGLSPAVLEGFRHARGSILAVMDGDLQHPPELLPEMLSRLDEADFVVASRRCKGGSFGGWGLKRALISLAANLLAMPLVPKVGDATAGYFCLRREALPDDLGVVSTRGFKVMLELLVKGRAGRIEQVPLVFGKRNAGESKLGGRVIWDYLLQLVGLYLWKFRWMRFGLVGLSGIGVHFPVLYLLTEAGLFYEASAAIAVLMASTNNYFLNNLWTFGERRRRGRGHLAGWMEYQALSAVGDGLYLGLLALFTEIAGLWYMLSAALGMTVVFILKFTFADRVIWRGFKGFGGDR